LKNGAAGPEMEGAGMGGGPGDVKTSMREQQIWDRHSPDRMRKKKSRRGGIAARGETRSALKRNEILPKKKV